MVPNGLIIYRGPSRINGAPILGILTGITRRSRNQATGECLQTWVLDATIDPAEAYYKGKNQAVCGDCAFAQYKVCYVPWWREPLSIWKAAHAGSYPDYDPALHNRFLAGWPHRMGAAGDPAALPLSLVRSLWLLAQRGRLWLCYTHQWHKAAFQSLKRYAMASCGSEKEFYQARQKGWKPYRTRQKDDPLLPGEFICPKAAEGGHRLVCTQCFACRGGTWRGQYTPAVIMHGTLPTTRANFVRSLDLVENTPCHTRSTS